MNTHLDYLRLASWKEGSYTSVLARIMRAWPEGWAQATWLQYSGWRKEEFFIGHGIQAKKPHTLIQISGGQANRMLPTLIDMRKWYATRIDIQITVEAHVMGASSLAMIRDECATKNTTLIESQENDTLYLGSRTSEKFTRLYEKYLDDKKYLRLEFELKGQRARTAWSAITGGESLDKIFKHYVKKSKLPVEVQEWFSAYGISATKEAMNAEILSSARKKLEWLQSLDAAVLKYAGNHDIGDEVKILLRSWAKYADHLDGLNDNSVESEGN